MTLKEFNLLCRNEQIDLLYQQGVYVGKRKKNDKVIVLYQLDGFYVEIFYIRYRQYITHMRCSDTARLLQPYLKQIDIEELMKCMS